MATVLSATFVKASKVDTTGTADAAGPERKYSPGECCGIRKHHVLGKPIKGLVSTSYVEKHNQTMRQQMRRLTLLTNGHSKKLENHIHIVALYTTWCSPPGAAALQVTVGR